MNQCILKSSCSFINKIINELAHIYCIESLKSLELFAYFKLPIQITFNKIKSTLITYLKRRRLFSND